MQPNLGRIGGARVHVSPFAVERRFTRKPRSKRRRIVKKWRKRAYNWSEKPAAYMLAGHGLIVHPAIYERMRERLTDAR